MKVSKLIEYLKQLPQDSEVVHFDYSKGAYVFTDDVLVEGKLYGDVPYFVYTPKEIVPEWLENKPSKKVVILR